MILSPAGLAAARAMSEDDLLAAVWGTPKRPGIGRARGWLGHHAHDSRRADAGLPDLVLVRDGRLIFAELKRETGRLHGAQPEWLDALRDVARLARAGAGMLRDDGRPVPPFVEVHLWRPSDLIAGTIRRALR